MKQSEMLATLKELHSDLLRYTAGSDSIVPGAYAEALDAAIKTLGRMRCISVKDRLPELKEKAICLNKHGDMMIGTYTEWGWIFPCYFGAPTHWMPLPELPKGENNGD